MKKLLCIAFSLIFADFCTAQITIHVPGDYTTIQGAIYAAADGDMVLVADGTYATSSNLYITFDGKAIVVISENGPENCIVDCNGSGRGFYLDSGEGPNSVVSGFTIMNASTSTGGGICCDNASPTIENCIITNNSASNVGGGIYCNSSTLIISDCIISGNSAGSGGGIYCNDSSPTIENCIITENTATNYSGGLYCNGGELTVTDCVISGNHANINGGGIWCLNTDISFENCEIISNSTVLETGDGGDGGGLFCSYSVLHLTDCDFVDNSSDRYGGGLRSNESDIYIERGIVTGNSASDRGGGLYINGNNPETADTSQILRCIISRDSCDDGAALYCVSTLLNVINSVIVGNVGNNGVVNFNNSSNTSITHCDFYNNGSSNFTGNTVPAGLGTTTTVNANGDSCDQYYNIFLDPDFYATTGDSAFYIWDDSPCVDAGVDTLQDPDGSISDIGAMWPPVPERDPMTIFVPGDYISIQEAINASINGDTIEVADGTWTGADNKNLDFDGRAISVRSANGPENCVIDCENSGRGFYLHSGEDNNSVLNGFSIVNGNGNDYGGGIYISGTSSPFILNCNIISSNAGTMGGGIFIGGSSFPILKGIQVENCTSSYGAGICVSEASIELNSCLILNNSSTNFGGGIYLGGAPYSYDHNINNCTFFGNTTTASGGGGVFISDNSSPSIINSLFHSNSAAGPGGGIEVYLGGITLNYCDFFANVPDSAAGISGGFGILSGQNANGDPCDVFNNIFLDPNFYATTGDSAFYIWDYSPCVDAGVDTLQDPDGSISDIGAMWPPVLPRDPMTIFVPGDYISIQEAIDNAINGDTVEVADGTYTGDGNRDLNFGGRAITLRSESGYTSCIIDCESGSRAFLFDCGETVASVLSGFTIVNGAAGYGGGINCYNNSSPTIEYCYINNDSATYSGGGIACNNNSNPIISNCVINSNLANDYDGGGIWCNDNSSPTISNCTINWNSAGDEGGGIHCENSSPIIEYCTINGDTAHDYGGGIFCHSNSSPTIVNCTITNNTATQYSGGGISCYDSDPTVVNTIVEGNFGEGGIYFNGSLNSSIAYCDFYNNVGGNLSGNPPPNLGTIAAVNANGDSCDEFFNILLDPRFFATIGDSAFYIWDDSPCVDAGDPDILDPDGSSPSDIGALWPPIASVQLSISGSIEFNEGVLYIPEVEVNLDGTATMSILSDETGFYEFTQLSEGQYTITPSRDEADFNGVEVNDCITIHNHLAQISIFDSPYQHIAGDVNETANVSISDVIKIKRYLAELENLPAGDWEFVDASFDLTFDNWFDAPNSISLTLEDTLTYQDFTGIRKGDVDGSWTVGGLDDQLFVNDRLALLIGKVDGLIGETVSLPIYANGVTNAAGVELHLTFNNDFLAFQNITSDYTDEPVTNCVENRIHFIWDDIDNLLTIPDGEPIAEISFNLVGEHKDIAAVSFDRANICDADAKSFGVALKDGRIRLIDPAIGHFITDYTLYQNRPNPFNPVSTISFDLPRGCDVSLKVYNIMGQVVSTVIDDYLAEGRHEFLFDATMLSSGIYFYHLQVADYQDIKKMVLAK